MVAVISLTFKQRHPMAMALLEGYSLGIRELEKPDRQYLPLQQLPV